MASELEKQMKAAEKEWEEGWRRGPTRLRWTELPPQVGDQAADFTLLDAYGRETTLSALWKEKPLLLIFWRHYGCGCGMDRAARLRKEYSDYDKAGANVAIIGQGEPERTAAYAAKHKLPAIPILCDPELKTYEAYGIVEGKTTQIFFDAPEPFLDRNYEAGIQLAEARRADDRPVVDNAWLMPCEYVIDQNGEIRLAYRYNYCEDFPDPRVHLAAIREARLAVKAG